MKSYYMYCYLSQCYRYTYLIDFKIVMLDIVIMC